MKSKNKLREYKNYTHRGNSDKENGPSDHQINYSLLYTILTHSKYFCEDAIYGT
jgi:hypothetical protein